MANETKQGVTIMKLNCFKLGLSEILYLIFFFFYTPKLDSCDVLEVLLVET